MFQNRQTAKQELDAARGLYEQVVALTDEPMLKQRAIYGLAKCQEAQGQFDQAKKNYEQIIESWGDSQLAALAKERLDELQRPETKQWYNWFAEQTPATSPLTDPSLFQDLPNLPESPDLKMPQPGQLLEPSSSLSEPPAQGTGNLPLLPDLGGADSTTSPGATGPDTLKLDLDGAAPADAKEPIERLDIDLPPDESTVPKSDTQLPSGGDPTEPELQIELPSGEGSAPEPESPASGDLPQP
jgi:hypothetical protein